MDGLAAACEGAQVQTGYPGPPPFSVEDNSDSKSTATFANDPTSPAHLDEDGPGDERVGEATTPAKRKRSDEDDSDSESTATFANDPASPAYLDEDGTGDERVGEATTPAKRERSDEYSHPKRQKLHDGLRCDFSDYLSSMIDEKSLLRVRLALSKLVTTLTVPGGNCSSDGAERYYDCEVSQAKIRRRCQGRDGDARGHSSASRTA
jgi:hypothetical protein